MASGDFETAATVRELIDILEGYGDDVSVVVEGRHEEQLNVEVADEVSSSNAVVIRGGLPVDA